MDEGDASGDLEIGAVVTVVQRSVSRKISNLDDLVEKLGEVEGVRSVNVVYFEDLEPLEQVRVIRKSTVLVAVEGGALDTFIFCRPNTVVLAFGRDKSTKTPEGGIVGGDDDKSYTISFWHEVSFSMWTRPGRKGLGLHVYAIEVEGPGYNVGVEQGVLGLKDGLKKLQHAPPSIWQNERDPEFKDAKADIAARTRAWKECLQSPPCDVGCIDGMVMWGDGIYNVDVV